MGDTKNIVFSGKHTIYIYWWHFFWWQRFYCTGRLDYEIYNVNLMLSKNLLKLWSISKCRPITKLGYCISIQFKISCLNRLPHVSKIAVVKCDVCQNSIPKFRFFTKKSFFTRLTVAGLDSRGLRNPILNSALSQTYKKVQFFNIFVVTIALHFYELTKCWSKINWSVNDLKPLQT